MFSFPPLRKPFAAATAVLALIALGTVGATPFTSAAETASVANPSLESDADNDRVPDCWRPQGEGQNKFTYKWSTAAHSGSRAEQVTVTGYRSGMRGLFVQMGSADCGVAVQPGRRYTLSVWVKTEGQAHFTTFYRDGSGAWVRWTSGPALPVSRSWTRADYLTPELPSAATELSFGIELRSGGTLTTDDYTLSDGAPPTASPTASATAAPTASGTPSPTAGTTSPTPSSPTTTSTAPSPSPSVPTSTPTSTSSAPPPASGYFTQLVAPGNVAALPSGGTCANAVHRSTWEPRPDNDKPNHTLVNAAAVHSSFAARPRSSPEYAYDYDPRWDSWLMPRIDGQFTGTTDEIIQWAACKWGLTDNFLRAEAERESTWFQSETYPAGRCVDKYGCGDWFGAEPYSARKSYCSGLAATGGYDYQMDYGDGLCPKTFSIVGVMSWWNPSWGFDWAGNQNGAFPFTRNSTAMALDYMASQIRGCYEGWEWQLRSHSSGYAAGDLWGCAGAWYSGIWHDAAADGYISRVQEEMSAKRWLDPDFPSWRPSCHPTYGCPGPTVLQ